MRHAKAFLEAEPAPGWKANAMSLHCLIHHHWVGGRCERCGALRDEQHDWGVIACRDIDSLRSMRPPSAVLLRRKGSFAVNHETMIL